jgi:hypothetical protein
MANGVRRQMAGRYALSLVRRTRDNLSRLQARRAAGLLKFALHTLNVAVRLQQLNADRLDTALTDDYTWGTPCNRCCSYNRRVESLGETIVRKVRTIIATAACLLACASLTAYAHGGGNGGGSGGGNGGGNGNGAALGAGVGVGHSDAGHTDGMSLGHMSHVGFSNTNSHVSADRDKGLARAGDRSGHHARSHSLHADGRSASHMSERGLSETNSHISADRDKGLARAADRSALPSQPHAGDPT